MLYFCNLNLFACTLKLQYDILTSVYVLSSFLMCSGENQEEASQLQVVIQYLKSMAKHCKSESEDSQTELLHCTGRPELADHEQTLNRVALRLSRYVHESTDAYQKRVESEAFSFPSSPEAARVDDSHFSHSLPPSAIYVPSI